MNTTVAEAEALAKAVVAKASHSGCKVLIAPPFTALQAVSAIVRGTDILLGAQNMGLEEKGAHTGEVSVLMLKDLGVSTVILGHSERRHVYGETDAQVNAKALLALKHGLDVILCVGETLDEREGGNLEKVVETQVLAGLNGVDAAGIAKITIAYEPVWAIGTGKTATPEDADAVHSFIRKVIAKSFCADTAKKICIQYGGSVKPDNVASLMAKENVDGALVGGASLTIDAFERIVLFSRP